MTGQPFPRPPEASRPAARYGDSPGRPAVRRGLVLLLAVAVAIAVGWWVWVAVVASNPPVRWQLLGFETRTERSVDIRWSVQRDHGQAVECVVRARNANGDEVGRDRVPVPAGADEQVEVQHTLTTSDEAVTGEVLTCLQTVG